jgi:ribosome modulation factor
MSKLSSEFYTEGWDAFYDGRAFNSCPYPATSSEGRQWRDGYLSAMEKEGVYF